MADSKHDALMRKVYYAFWCPHATSFEHSGGPDWKEAARAVAHPEDCHCRWCKESGGRPVVSRATLYNARKWALERKMPVRPLRGSPRSMKLDPVTALAMCELAFGEDADTKRSCEEIAGSFGVTRGTLYNSYRPKFLDKSLHKMAAEHAKRAQRPKSA